MKTIRSIAFVLLTAILTGCASSKMSQLPRSRSEKHSHPIRKITILPKSGILATAIGIELSQLGYTVIDSASTARLLARLRVETSEVEDTLNLEKLKSKGIDAYLTARSLVGYDGQIQSANARVFSTHTGRVVAGVSWQNGWGGRAGSIADRIMKKRVTEAGKDIARSLSKSFPKE